MVNIAHLGISGEFGERSDNRARLQRTILKIQAAEKAMRCNRL